MKQNIGNFDRLLRVAIGVFLLFFAIYFKSGFLFIFALFSFYEAFAGWCIFYQLIGRNTCPVKTNKPQKIPIINIFLKGLIILLGAIILNLIGAILNFYNWSLQMASELIYLVFHIEVIFPILICDIWILIL